MSKNLSKIYKFWKKKQLCQTVKLHYFFEKFKCHAVLKKLTSLATTFKKNPVHYLSLYKFLHIAKTILLANCINIYFFLFNYFSMNFE